MKIFNEELKLCREYNVAMNVNFLLKHTGQNGFLPFLRIRTNSTLFQTKWPFCFLCMNDILCAEIRFEITKNILSFSH